MEELRIDLEEFSGQIGKLEKTAQETEALKYEMHEGEGRLKTVREISACLAEMNALLQKMEELRVLDTKALRQIISEWKGTDRSLAATILDAALGPALQSGKE